MLGIVDENFAAGVLYAIDNVHNSTYNVMVYNLGSTATQVSIHTHDTYTVKEVGALCVSRVNLNLADVLTCHTECEVEAPSALLLWLWLHVGHWRPV